MDLSLVARKIKLDELHRRISSKIIRSYEWEKESEIKAMTEYGI
jgi:hypothetical protein